MTANESWSPPAEKAVILALSYSSGQMGAAIYDQSSTTIRILHDVGEDADFRMIESLILQTTPTVLLLNKAQDLQLIRHFSEKYGSNPDADSSFDIPPPTTSESTMTEENEFISRVGDSNQKRLRDEMESGGDEEEETDENREDCEEEEDAVEAAAAANQLERQPIVHLMPNNSYKYDGAIVRISELFAEESFCEYENNLIVKFRIDTKSINMVRSFGALLKYMDAVRVGVEFDSFNVRTPVSSIRTFVIEAMVEMDTATYRALEIFGEDRKKEAGWRKAILTDPSRATIFSLCNRCRSTPGRHTLRHWFEHPTLNRKTLVDRQKAISFFVQDCNLDVTSLVHQHLGKIRSVRMILKRMRASTCKVSHWNNIYDTLLHLSAIGRCLRQKDVRLSILEPLMTFFGDQLSEITSVVATICDFDESRVENRLVVKMGVDATLDETKHIYRQLPSILTSVAREEATRLRAKSCSVGYVPMVGYLLALPVDFPLDRFPELQLIYGTSSNVHVKSDGMTRLDEELGDIKMQIIDKETTVMLRLQKLVLDSSTVLLGAARAAAVLDAVIALAMTARHLGWNCPSLVDEAVLEATQLVHPLAQLFAKDGQFVANPVSSGGESTKVKVFTGPNACGKSVYLKQVGVLAFLAHIGSYVPAQRAVVGPINRILSRMYTVDGVLDGMSTFAKDLSQLAVALRRGNQFSLVIVDEFGKGTMTEVGLSLLASSLSHWLSKGTDGCPHVFVSSHFHALPQLIEIDERIISFHTLEVLRRGARLDFQYRLVEGVVDNSFAAYTAARMGVDQNVVDRATKVYDGLRSGSNLNEIRGDDEEERKCEWMAGRMDNIIYEFESWDLERDLAGLLDRLEEVLLQEDETMNSTHLEMGAGDTDGNGGAEGEGEMNHDEEERAGQTDNCDEVAALVGLDESTASVDEDQPIEGSILRKGKKCDRSNLSVSFAMEATIAEPSSSSDQPGEGEEMGRQNRQKRTSPTASSSSRLDTDNICLQPASSHEHGSGLNMLDPGLSTPVGEGEGVAAKRFRSC